jgi:hypothetical protein
MKNSDTDICSVIETRMNEIIDKINKTDSIFESDILDSELRILDWIFYLVCKDQQKNWKGVCDTKHSNFLKVTATFEALNNLL